MDLPFFAMNISQIQLMSSCMLEWRVDPNERCAGKESANRRARYFV